MEIALQEMLTAILNLSAAIISIIVVTVEAYRRRREQGVTQELEKIVASVNGLRDHFHQEADSLVHGLTSLSDSVVQLTNKVGGEFDKILNALIRIAEKRRK